MERNQEVQYRLNVFRTPNVEWYYAAEESKYKNMRQCGALERIQALNK